MSKVVSIILLLTLGLTVNAQSTADSAFLSANEAYSSGEFEKAFKLYKGVLAEGLESPELYFNMGNAAFRSNKLGYSILYYRKALKLEPGFEDAKTNLDYVSTYMEDNLEVVPELFLKTWLNSLFSLLNANLWSYIAVIFFGIILTGVTIYIFAARLTFKKAGFFSALFSTIFFLIAISGAIRQNNEIKNPKEGVIVAPSIVVKSTPSMSGTDLFVLHEGTSIITDEKVGDWIEIRISDGRVGWISKESMEII